MQFEADFSIVIQQFLWYNSEWGSLHAKRFLGLTRKEHFYDEVSEILLIRLASTQSLHSRKK